MTDAADASASTERRSFAPDGTSYRLPDPAESAAGMAALRTAAEAHRRRGGKVVAVQGLGFVGSAVAAAIASARDAAGNPLYFVIGVDLATPQSYWKIGKMNDGLVAIPSPDQELTALIHEAACIAKNLVATADSSAYDLADTIVVDLPLDVVERFAESEQHIAVRLEPFEAALRTIGERMRPDALVLVETTVPIGICERVALPILQSARAQRGIQSPLLLAHAYERVMPGPNYVASIKRFWRTYSGIDATSAAAARRFLESFVETERYPLQELSNTVSSELAKVLENSYRAVNIAFIHEWTRLAEQIGVNLFEVVNSIRVRKGTHDNMRFPGFGVGGYCLTKDSLLAQWSATTLFKTNISLRMTLDALRVNNAMPLHTLDLAREAAGGDLTKPLVVAGVSYLAEVADTRNTPSEILADALVAANARFVTTDPYLKLWVERPELAFTDSLEEALLEAAGIIFTVPHKRYRALRPDDFFELAPRLEYVVDAFDILNDATAAGLHARGVRVIGVGKGHWRAMGYQR